MINLKRKSVYLNKEEIQMTEVLISGNYKAKKDKINNSRISATVFYCLQDVTDCDQDDRMSNVRCLTSGVFTQDWIEGERSIIFPFTKGKIERMPIFSFPEFSMQFERKGSRKVRIGVEIVSDSETIFSTSVETKMNQNVSGYRDNSSKYLKCISQIAELGMFFTAADGRIDDIEVERLECIIKDKMLKYEFSALDSAEISRVLTRARRTISVKKINFEKKIKSICNKLHSNETNDFCKETFQVCTQIVSADGVSTKNELKYLKQVGDCLKITARAQDDIRELYLIQSTTEHCMEDYFPEWKESWLKEEKRKFLRTKYRHYSNLVSSKNAGIARDAGRKLKVIAYMRSKIDS